MTDKLASAEEYLTHRANELGRGHGEMLGAYAESQVSFIKVTALDIASGAIHLIRKLTGSLSSEEHIDGK